MDFLNKEFTEERAVDPVLRCDSCNSLVKLTTLHKLGCCPDCGNKRVRSLNIFDETERDKIKEWGYEDFLKEWEAIDE